MTSQSRRRRASKSIRILTLIKSKSLRVTGLVFLCVCLFFSDATLVKLSKNVNHERNISRTPASGDRRLSPLPSLTTTHEPPFPDPYHFTPCPSFPTQLLSFFSRLYQYSRPSSTVPALAALPTDDAGSPSLPALTVHIFPPHQAAAVLHHLLPLITPSISRPPRPFASPLGLWRE